MENDPLLSAYDAGTGSRHASPASLLLELTRAVQSEEDIGALLETIARAARLVEVTV